MNYITEIKRRRTFAIITYMASVLVLSITSCAYQKDITSLSYIDRKHVNPVEKLGWKCSSPNCFTEFGLGIIFRVSIL